MSVFSASIRHRSYTWQISALCFVLGILLAAAWHTVNRISRSGITSSRTEFPWPVNQQAMHEQKEKAEKYEAEINSLRGKVTKLEKMVASGDDASETLNKELQQLKLLAGLTDVVGTGVRIQLEDSRKTPANALSNDTQENLIHDYNIDAVVNELRAAGAEAIAINGQRVVGFTAIRCVGPVIQVNGVPTSPPVILEAVGDPEALFGGLNTPGGVLDAIRRYDPKMVRMEKKTAIELPAYAGNTQLRHVKVRKPASKEKESKGKA